VTPRQVVAYSRPCYEAEDTIAPRYGFLRGGREMFSVRLTANIGLE
jgi:hypothetical protein